MGESEHRKSPGEGTDGPDEQARSPRHAPEAYAETQSGDAAGTHLYPGRSGRSDPPERRSGPRPGAGESESWHEHASGPSEARADAEEPSDGEGPDPYIGRVLSGLYKVQDRIGEGGMGTVYMALHVHLNKPFAVKVLSPSVAENRGAVDRLRQEAQAASSIDHENIVNVVNFDATDEGEVFIVMELLKGESLASIMEGGEPLPLERALGITYQIGHALGTAHERGIVHRDLKPENVFLVERPEGEVAKVLDFGISKVKSAEAEQVRMTRTGQLVGTPLYMSPEQARGETDVDHRADIYALGVILYEMLTGVPPFRGNNYFQLLWKHGNEQPDPPSSHAPKGSIPPAVERVVLRTLAKQPSERHQSMAELEQALTEAAPDVPVPGRYGSLIPRQTRPTPQTLPGSRPPIGKGGLAAAAVVLLVLGMALGGWALRRQGESSASAPGGAAPGAGEATTERGHTGTGAAEQGGASASGGSAEEKPEGDAVAKQSSDGGRQLPTGMEAPSPRKVTLELDSRPEGARVQIGDRVLGTTPLEASVTDDGGEVRIRFSRRGYADKVVSVVPEEGKRIRERLRPRRSRRRQGRDEDPLPIKKEL